LVVFNVYLTIIEFINGTYFSHSKISNFPFLYCMFGGALVSTIFIFHICHHKLFISSYIEEHFKFSDTLLLKTK